jgi:23S rRNA (guanosine2251-2'-O)-methyltransferase
VNEATLEGWLSVRAALIARQRDVHEILLQRGKDHPRIAALLKRAREADIPVKQVDQATIDSLSNGSTHGGVIARVGERHYHDLASLGEGPNAPFLAMLDGVEDPFNFGQAVRALYAAGAHGLVVRSRNWLSAAAVVTRASAGATEFIRAAIADDDAALVAILKRRDIQLITTDMGEDSTPLFESDLTVPLMLVIGGERRGVSKYLQKHADLRVTIPYGRDFRQALGTTPASAILAFEVLRQRSR